MTWHGVTQMGRTPTRSSPTTTTLTLIAITPDTTVCLRTSLARANQSWWHQKIRAVCVEINNRPLAFLPALCCHQWKATAKVEHQTRAANKALVRTVCRHKLDTAFTFVFLSGWDPSQFCPASHEKSGTFRTNFWYMITIRKQEEDCMSPWFSLYSTEGKIYLFS